MTNNRFITVEEVIDRVSISRTHLYRLIKDGNFPKQVPIGQYKVAFLESEIEDWISSRLEARENGEGVKIRQDRAKRSAQGRVS